MGSVSIYKTKRNLIQIWLLGAAVLQALTSGAQPVTKVAARYCQSLFLKSYSSLMRLTLVLLPSAFDQWLRAARPFIGCANLDYPCKFHEINTLSWAFNMFPCCSIWFCGLSPKLGIGRHTA